MATEIVRRDPVTAPIRQIMDRFFDDPFFRDPFMRMPIGFTTEDGTLPLDVYEKDGRLWVEASLPGFKKEEIDVQVHDGVLSIRAQRSAEQEEHSNGDRYYRRERTWGAVSRRVALPGIVQDAPVEAELKNGILKLQIPLPEKAQPKQIEIKGE